MSGGVNSDSSIVSSVDLGVVGVAEVVVGDGVDESSLASPSLASLPLPFVFFSSSLEAVGGFAAVAAFGGDAESPEAVLSAGGEALEGSLEAVVAVVVDLVAFFFDCCSSSRPCFNIRSSSSRATSQTLASATMSFNSRLGKPSVKRNNEDVRSFSVAGDEAMAICSSKVRVELLETEVDVSPPAPALVFFFFLKPPPLLSVAVLLPFLLFSSLTPPVAPVDEAAAVALVGVALRGRFLDTPSLLLLLVGVAERPALPLADFLVLWMAGVPSPMVGCCSCGSDRLPIVVLVEECRSSGGPMH